MGSDSKRPMERRHGKHYIILKRSHAKNWKPKGKQKSKSPKKAICIKTKYWTILVQDWQSSSPSVSWKLNTSLTQKDTMDRGAWIKKFRKKEKRRTQKKGQKSKSTKVQNGMGMRNKWIFLFTICYNPVVSKVEDTRKQR